MSTELGEFFSLIGKARQEKEEEFQSLVGEINIDSLFAEVKTSVAEDKKKKKKKLEEDKKKKAKEKRQVKALESWLYSEPKQEEKLEIEDANGDVAFEVVDLITPEPLKPSEPVVEEQEEPEEISEEAEEIPEDTVDHALKILETIKSKEEVQENVNDPEIIKIRRELEYLKNLVNAQGGGGEVNLRYLDDIVGIATNLSAYDGMYLGIDASNSSQPFVFSSVSGGGGSTAGIDTTGTSHFKNLSLTGITTGLNVSGIATVGRLAGFKALVGAESSTTEIFVTTVDSKTTNHRYHGSGSSSAYFLDGIESPFLTLLPGKTYRFDQSDSSNSGHPLRFYLEADKTTAYTTNVTTNGTAGSSGAYTEILVTDSTPLVLHYQCSSHGYMGNSSFLNSNLVDTPYQITARSGINVTGIVTATSFVGDLTGDVTGNADTATTATTATNAQGLTGTPNITVGNITATYAEFSGNVAVGGTITYEDVKNVDSLGIVTARTGVDVLAGGINVVGVSTISTGVGTVHVGVGSTALLVEGDARVTGILTIGQGSITLDPNARKIEGIDEIIIGTATTVTIKQDAQGEVKFEDKDGKQASVGIGTTVSINTTGIVTATSFVGNLTGNVTGDLTGDVTGTATTATNAVQLKTARTIAGVSFDGTSDISLNNNAITNGAGYITTSFTNTNELTNGAGFISDVADDTTPQLGGNLDLNSKDITGTGSINISGIVTANAFHGDGTNLTGVGGGSVISGITIKEEGSTVGTAGTVVSLNFVGDNITATSSGSGATITASPTPTFDSVSVGIATASTAFYMPQYTTTARDAASFNEGAMIYNTTTKKINFYNGTSWTELPGMTLGLTVALDG